MDNKMLIIQKFDGTNFYMWKFKVELVLQRDKLWNTVIQEPPSPITDEWTLRDQAAKATICLAMEDKFLINVRTCTTAKNTWQTLLGIYEHPSLSGKIHLMRRLYGTRYEHYSNMRDYVNSVLELVGQLRNVGEITKDRNIIALLLCGLPIEFNNLITAIESKDDDSITLDYVKIKLFEEATRREKELVNNSVESLAMPSLKLNSQTRSITCYGCGQQGHTKRDCTKDTNRIDNSKLKSHYIDRKPYQQDRGHNIMMSTQHEGFTDIDQPTTTHNDEETGTHHHLSCCPCNSNNETKYTALSGTISEKQDYSGWILDSGASAHMTPNKDFFQEITYLKNKIPVKLANGNIVYAEGKGSGLVNLDNEIRPNDTIQIKDILFVPSLQFQLLSIRQLCERGHDVKFNKGDCHIFNSDNKLIASAKLVGSVFKLQEKQMQIASPCIHLWHNRLGHKSHRTLDQMDRNKLVAKMSIDKCNHSNFCKPCHLGKMRQKSFKTSSEVITKPFQTIVSDLCGPLQVPSLGGNNYILTLTDKFSRFIHVDLLKHKSQAAIQIQNYIERGHNLFGYYPLIFRSDGGGEFSNSQLDNYFKVHGITHQLAAPYVPQQNGNSERVNATLLSMCRCMLKQHNLPLKLWGEAVTMAAYIINRTIHYGIGKTPYELWNGKLPNLTNMKTFGCRAYAFKPKILRKKLDDTSTEGIFVGPGINTKGYRLWIPGTNTVITTAKMTFDESPFMYDDIYPQEQDTTIHLNIPSDDFCDDTPPRENSLRRSARENKGIPPTKLTY